MTALAATLLLTVLLLAGCAGGSGGAAGSSMPNDATERALCEQSRGGGVWVPSAGACLRGGGSM